jgi:hypothetical protein
MTRFKDATQQQEATVLDTSKFTDLAFPSPFLMVRRSVEICKT